MTIKIINPSTDQRWDRFVFNNENSSIYHHSSWKELIDRTFKHVYPLYYIQENKDQEIETGIATFFVKSYLTGKRLVSPPLATYCNIIGTDPHKIKKILTHVILQAQKLDVDYVALKMNRQTGMFDSLESEICDQYMTHILPLNPPLKELFRSFHNTTIRQRIKKADKSGLKLVTGKSIDDMEEFYRLHLLTRKKHGLPAHPRTFFRNMWDILYPKGFLTLLLAEYSGQNIAALLLLKYKSITFSEYGASDIRFLHLNPNHWLYWKAIELSKDEGFEYFDFGRSSKLNKGLVDFKKRWNSEENFLYYYYFPKKSATTSSTEDSRKYKAMQTVIKRSPPRVTEWIGNILYNHLGG